VKPVLALAAAGLGALWVRGVLSWVLPASACPDLGLVFVIGLGLHAPGAAGLVLAAGLGYVADVLAGSLLGQHALLFAVAFGLTRIAGARLALGRGLATWAWVAALTAAHGAGVVLLTRFFTAAHGWPEPGRLALQMAVNALVAFPLLAGVAAVVHAFEPDRRAVELAPRRREA
jgi:rod shape-determining protein MreD